MTYAGWGAFGHGAVVFPLDDTVAAETSLLELADPLLFAMLDFLPAVLDLELGAALKQYALRVGIKINEAVLTKANAEPVPALYADKTRFPFFALYRKGEQHTGHTTSFDKSVGEWEFAYVLPALMPGTPQDNLVPILHAVGRTIGHAVRRGRHPSYGAGREVLKEAGCMSARLVATRYERYERMNSAAGSNNEQFFRAIVGTLEVVERDMPVDGAFEPFAGANVAIANKQNGQAALDVATLPTSPPPTITSVTPNSGTKAGGTLIVIGGTNFRTPMTLTIAGINVPVTITDAAHASAITPQVETTFDRMAELVLVGLDGQAARSPAGFTFTTP